VAVDALFSTSSTLAKVQSLRSFTSQNQEWSHQRQSQFDLYTCHSFANDSTVDKYRGSSCNLQAQVLRLGMDIAAYREGCRHFHAILLTLAGTEGDHEEKGFQPIPVSSTSSLGKMIQDSWHVAADLLRQATQIASLLKVESGHGIASKKHSSRSLDTLCHHVQFVITGQFRRQKTLGDNKRSSSSIMEETSTKEISDAAMSLHHQQRYPNDPPPIDLFDRLLLELQHAVAMVT
jgi:hypothetical protein